MRRAWTLLLSALLLPLTSATEAEGSFTVEGPMTFPEGSHAEASPLAFYVPDTAATTGFHATAVRATILEIVKTYQVVETGLLPPTLLRTSERQRSWSVEAMEMRPLPHGDHSGYLAINVSGASLVRVEAQEEMLMEPRPFSAIGNGETNKGDDAESINYHQEVAQPHFFVSGAGSVEYEGRDGLKLRGLDVEIRSANVTTHRTGFQQTGPSEITFTVLYVRFDATGTVTLPNVAFETAVTAPLLEWNGRLRFIPTEGSLHARGGTYIPRGGTADLEGSFTARLSALPDGRHAQMNINGDLRESSLTFQQASAPLIRKESAPWLLVLLLGTVLAGGGAGFYLWHRRHRSNARVQEAPPTEPEICTDLASIWIEAGEFERALKWIRWAKERAPTSARVAATEAFCLAKLGHLEEAVQSFEQADALSGDGEAAYEAASTLAHLNAPPETIEKWLMRALEKSPSLVTRAEADFPEAAARETWAPIARKAWDRIEEEWRP